ncbi:MAG TPA: DAK2 domain-containing protein [Candidatus Acetatifactor stercoripullorum]|uniref:DAK2 domain-containing protein n=1 Tax=Candidatus Acetatifactor stercoripullorum TaxID=2838414 RepID=A0A9D1R6B5_9FIRM|nr:DAK2 domain-containing protein [uncultured Acetatifactor sp.]HIW82323.1 DAK2 domain-containing protein [Candidatus Acetatifactor stercoripullorum]
MDLQQIDAKMLSKMFLAGAKNLENKKEWINELNVFPVPDGDTGTNMTMTIMSAAREVSALGENADMGSICKAISSGSLRGARGNSGVILSQLFRGFTKSIREESILTVPVFTAAFEKAVETAYKAVMKPKEGTILTVARGVSEKAKELSEDGVENLEEFFGAVLEHARYVLSQTPEMLPVLKQAGVVDSGGQGLVEVLSGAFEAFLGKEVDLSLAPSDQGASSVSRSASMEAQAEAEIKFGYCTEFIILLNKPFNVKAEMDFKAYLESIGDSIVCVADEDVVKVHVHTNDPGLAIQKALKYGALSNMKIDNMRLEHQEKLFKMSEKEASQKAAEETEKKAGEAKKESEAAEEANKPPKAMGFIAVSIGEGLNEIFSSLGVDYIIEGGQTMNPSTADILDAVEKVNAETIFILPNNKNIILAANQAAELVTDKNLLVIPTKTIPQGITAVINFVPELSADENEEAMLREITNVKTGQVTYAVRDTVIDDKEIRKGDYMGIGDKGILAAGESLTNITEKMVSEMVDDASELISVYFGCDVDEADAQLLKESLESAYPSCDIELQYGGQPIYYYVISVE